MKKSKFTISLLVITILFFSISYLSSRLINQNERKMFPLSILKGYSQSFGEVYPVTLNKSFSGNSIQEINIDVVNTDTQIKNITGSDIIITLKGKYFNIRNPDKVLHCHIQNNKFTLKTDEQTRNYYVNFEGKMIIAIPKSIKKITYQGKFGDVNLESMNLKYFKATTITGDISFLGAKCQALEINTVDGDFYVKGEVDKLSINTIRGNARLWLSNSNPYVTFKSNSGDMFLTFNSQPNILINFSSVNGELILDKTFMIDQKELKMPIKLGNGGGNLSINTVSGDSHVNKD